DEVKEIQSNLNTGHQTVMFSATMNDKVRRLSGQLLTNPEYVEQERKTMVADTITHKLMHVRHKDKTNLLVKLLEGESIDKALIFARTKLGADKLCDDLKYAFDDTPMRIDAIHGDKKQRTREKILMNYRKGRTKVLVATDVAARGIDVDGITHVINYELPIEAENYVHRVGRTGRAGSTGLAISFCDPSDFRLLREIERLIKMKVDVDPDHDYHFEAADVRESKGGGRGGGKGRGKFDKPRGRGGDRNSRGPKRDDRGGPRRDSNDRPRRDNDDRPRRDSDDRPRNDRPRRDSDDRSRNDRPRNDRPRRDNDDRPRRDRDDRPHKSYGDRDNTRKHTKHTDGHLGTDKPGDRRPERKQKQEGPRYNPTKFDPIDTSSNFDDDPVLAKLRGAGEKRKARVEPRDAEGGKKKKSTKGDHYDNKKASPKKSFKKDGPKDNKKPEGKPGERGTLSRKPSTGKPAAKRTGKPSRADRKKIKQTGGHKSFSPKR
ncbi:MAG: DEAD/DEAH box helicase, partial [Emcibacteraceae bacterium]|nr:DEAD/DEAH box helicase [Emcibacteraceae bacterium]